MRSVSAALAVWLLASCSDSSGPSKAAPPAAPPGATAPERDRVISRGTAFSKEDYLVPGYVVILDFYADW